MNREEECPLRIGSPNRWGEANIRENKLDGQGNNSCGGDLDNVAYNVFCLTLNMISSKIKLCESGGMVYAADLKSASEKIEGSSPSSRTKF